MKQVYIDQITDHEGEKVTINGWLYNKRSIGKIDFLLIRDGTGIIQTIASKPELPDETVQRLKAVTLQSSVIVTGIVHRDERAPGGYELSLRDLNIIQLA